MPAATEERVSEAALEILSRPPEAPPPPTPAGPVFGAEPVSGPERLSGSEPLSSEPAAGAAPALRIPAIDWERWIGVQGAAVLGGIALAFAGLLFFRYSIEHGLLSPTLRVTLGTATGLGCLVGTQLRWRRTYPDAANALSGAGLVILYASFWAARNLYGLIDLGTAFTLMALVTAVGCLLAVREGSLLVALLGLVGGFATPFLLSSGEDRPIGLFGYVLLLDLAMVTIARRRGWPLLALLSLVATVLYQAFWIGLRMGPDRLALGLVILGVFAALFAFAGPRDEEDESREWRLTQAGAVLLPFAFGLYIAGNARLGAHLFPVALLLSFLAAGASWVARRQHREWLALGAASGVDAVVLVWTLTHALGRAGAWELAACAAALGLVFHAFTEWGAAEPGLAGPAPAAAVSAGGLLASAIVGAILAADPAPWPWLAAWLGLGVLLVRQGVGAGREWLQLAGWAGVAAGLSLSVLSRGNEAGFPVLPLTLATMILVAAASHVSAFLVLEPPARRAAERAAALLPLILLAALAVAGGPAPAAVFLGGTLGLGFLSLLAATRLGSGPWALAAAAFTVFAHTAWTGHAREPSAALVGLVIQALGVGLFTAWPFLVRERFAAEPAAWIAAALVGPAWFLSLRELFVAGFGDRFIGLLPLGLAATSLAAAAEVRSVWPESDPRRTSGLAWFGAVTLGFVAVAVPLQLEKEWITIGWALEALAVAMLWRRLDHPGLKWFALALAAAVTARLVANDEVLGYHARPSVRILNWIAYTYLAPGAALAAAGVVFSRGEVARVRPWESALYRRGVPVAAAACGLGAVAIVFVWINLAIADWFSTGEMVTLRFERMPARDLTVSIAWAGYALVLLALGVARNVTGLRWLSLLFLLLTIGKVFLYDLGALEDLFRVMSLLGLAVSLILVSLAYQRFVFRKLPSEGS